MKILHVITGLGDGGAEGVLLRLTTSDSTNAHQVISLTHEGVHGLRLGAAGIPVHALGMPRGRVTLRGLFKLYQLVRRMQPDVVQTWMYHADLIGGVVARLAGRGTVVWSIRNASLNAQLISRTTRWVARLCAWGSRALPTRIVSCSARAAERHVAFGYDHRKMVVIPNGYDTSCFAPDLAARSELRMGLNLGGDVVLLGMVARWNAQKDHQNLINALSALARMPGREWRCLLVGPGMLPENAELVDLLASSGVGDRVVLLGPRRDIPPVMNAIDLHVLSSASEGFPNVVAEAMASGTPCVVTDVGDAALIVGETGWVVPARDSGQLATAIVEAVSAMGDEASWTRRKRAARQRILAHFSLDRMVQAYTEVWHEAAKL
mgnify:CR=1 FL=1